MHDPSEVVDPAAFAWDPAGDAWPGLTMDNLVVYELHIGTYTRAGTYDALIAELPELARLGVTALELMPVNEFPGSRNWGYDGVDWYAPTRAYGRPDALRRLIQAAHAAGLGIILDVVYNHFLCAPETPLLFMGQEFAASTPFLYFTDHHEELGKLVTEGRRREFSGFRAFHDGRARDLIPDPQAEATFLASRLDLTERELPAHAGIHALYQALLALRRDDPVPRVQDRARTRAVVAGAQALLLHRWTDEGHRVLAANFGSAPRVELARSEALARVAAEAWSPLLSTDEARFGGVGRTATLEGSILTVPARTATLFTAGGHAGGARSPG